MFLRFDYVLLWTSRRSSVRTDMHNFIIRSDDMSRSPYDIMKSLEFVLLNLDIQTRTERVSVYCRSHCFLLSRLIMNLIFISWTEILDQSDGSTDLINNTLFWHVTSDRVRTYSSRYMTSILNSKRGCRQSYSLSSRYILKSSDIWMTTSFCSYDFSSTLSLFSKQYLIIWRGPFDVSSVIRFLFYFVLSSADCKSDLFRCILITRKHVDENDDDLL